MNILAFDTCFDACSVAVLRADGEVATERVLIRRGHAEALVPMIGRTMGAAMMAFDELDRIAVTHGPGSFTGTRVGMAAAIGFAFAHDLPVVTYSSLLCIARAGIERLATRRNNYDGIVVVRDAKRGSVYIEIADMKGREIVPASLKSISEARALISASARQTSPGADPPGAPVQKHYFGMGTGISLLLAGADGAGLPGLRSDWPAVGEQGDTTTPDDMDNPDARYMLQDTALREPATPPRPLYLRPPDAAPSSVPPLARLQALAPGEPNV